MPEGKFRVTIGGIFIESEHGTPGYIEPIAQFVMDEDQMQDLFEHMESCEEAEKLYNDLSSCVRKHLKHGGDEKLKKKGRNA